jgi:glutathione S-transferase
MLLDLMEMPYHLHDVDAEAQKSDDYRALNPFGQLPTLKHGSRVILESGAQMMYLADLAPDKRMAPAVGTIERGRYYEWFVLNIATLEPMGSAGVQNPQDPEAQAGMQLAASIIEERLTLPYACGDAFSAVDVMLHWQFNMLQSIGVLDAMPKAAAYYRGLTSRMDWTGY